MILQRGWQWDLGSLVGRMLKLTFCVILLGGMTLPLLGLTGTAVAAASATVALVPSATQIAAGQIVTVDVSLSGVDSLYAGEVHLSFDKQKLRVVNPSTGEPASSIQPGALLNPSVSAGIVKNQANNDSGTVDYAVTLVAPDAPVSGSGILARIAFKAIGIGTASITLQNPLQGEPAVKLADDDCAPIGVSIPTASLNITISNTQPTVANVVASQRAGTGVVSISYDVADTSESTLGISFQYWDGGQWLDCQNTSGEGNVSLGTGKTGTWNAKLDFDSQYRTDTKIKVIANDGQSANNTGQGESSAFTLDTKSPTGLGCSSPENNAVDVSANPPLTSLVGTDDSAPIQYQFRLAEDDAFTQGVQQSSWLDTSNWSPATLKYLQSYWWQVQAKDAYGNAISWSNAYSFTTGAMVLVEQTISPTAEATVATADGLITVIFPAGAVATEAKVTIRGEPLASAPPPPAGFKAGTTYFTIEMTEDLAPGTTVTIVVKYSDADVEAAGGDTNLLNIAYYDSAAGEWKVLPTTVDTANHTLTAETNHLSRWMVLAEIPATGGGLQAWVWILIGVGVAIIAGAILWWRLARRPATEVVPK